MAVVKFTPLAWKCDDAQSILDHIQQFHEKFKEVGVIHVPKDTDTDFTDTSIVNFFNTVSSILSTRTICTFYYKLPKGDGSINYSPPDADGVQEIVSFSPKPYDLYIKMVWRLTKSSYISTVSRCNDLDCYIQLSRADDFENSVTRPSFSTSMFYYSSYGNNGHYNGTTPSILAESVISLTPDGLVVLHGLYNLNTGRAYGYGGPRMLMQFVINVQDDGVISIYDVDYNINYNTTDYGSAFSGSHKYCYNYKIYDLTNYVRSYSRNVNVTPFPFTDIPNYVHGELQGLPCYSLNKNDMVVETYNVYAFGRGLPTGDNDFYVYRDGKVLKRILYAQELNSMTPSTSGTWSTTAKDYNREYGHIIEYAPMINVVPEYEI